MIAWLVLAALLCLWAIVVLLLKATDHGDDDDATGWGSPR